MSALPSGAPPTTIVENARLELLRLFAMLSDWLDSMRAASVAKGEDPDTWPTHSPLFEGEWDNADADIILAMEEAVKLGHLESTALHASADAGARIIAGLRGGREWMVRITPAGYAWIKAHDAIGEASQEVTRV